MLKQTLLFLLIFFFVALFLLYVFQRHLIYFPSHQTPKLQDFQATDMTLVSLKTKDNIVLHSWYKPAKNDQPTLLYLHGNAGHIGYRMPLVRQFINSGLGVFLLEYRGYGGNSGSPNEQGLYEDGRTALQFLIQNKIDSKKVIVFGESLGTGIATQLATEYPVCAVILQSPFTSLTSLSRYHYPWLFLKPWDRFNSLERIKQINAPLLVIHGKKDEIVPFNEGFTLFNQANAPKKLLVFDNKGHNNLWGANGFYEGVNDFLLTSCGTKQ